MTSWQFRLIKAIATVKSSFLSSFSNLLHSYLCMSAGAHLIFCEPVQGTKVVVNYGGVGVGCE